MNMALKGRVENYLPIFVRDEVKGKRLSLYNCPMWLLINGCR